MTATADILRTLHRIHRQLSDLRERLNRGPRKVKAHRAGVAQLESQLAETREKSTAARMASDNKQLQLKTGESKIVDLRTKLNVCSSNREYQALLEQIAADEMTNSVLEDEILEGLEKIELLQVSVSDAQAAVAKGRDELAKNEAKVRDESAQIHSEIARLETELTESETQLPSDFLTDYRRVVQKKGEEAMAAVEDGHCVGCYQKITPNMQSHLMMAQVVCCTACGRMLYLAEV